MIEKVFRVSETNYTIQMLPVRAIMRQTKYFDMVPVIVKQLHAPKSTISTEFSTTKRNCHTTKSTIIILNMIKMIPVTTLNGVCACLVPK